MNESEIDLDNLPLAEALSFADEGSTTGGLLTHAALKTLAAGCRELTAARAEIERLDTVGIHSCHDNCQRWTCVLRRERDEARAEICHMVSENGNMYLEIFIARNQRDRLAEALRECLERLEHHTEFGALVQADMSAMHSSREALKSLTTTEQ